ncbi:hypothetical protein GF108_00100 [Phyllobacterium sp. SYP-B3895]|uniref:hypothetical protein n=1 Tax=Phyllobacterium sp. SYP-B3895 TaxID=2663240 RepID=UPI0012996386|nr:hypothetical protein [Phyllobacterium sp. SYP-B3895]MRG53986.1 hypothetical protein [Phyllobacterium sp. SYP-B3895]
MIDPDAWCVRRSLVIGTILWCGGIVTYITFAGGESSLRETVAVGALTLAGSTLGSYVFGAIWDDQNKRRFGVGGRRVETRVEEVTPATPVAPIGEEGP